MYTYIRTFKAYHSTQLINSQNRKSLSGTPSRWRRREPDDNGMQSNIHRAERIVDRLFKLWISLFKQQFISYKNNILCSTTLQINSLLFCIK